MNCWIREDSELKRMWNKVVVAYLRYTDNFPERRTMKTPRQEVSSLGTGYVLNKGLIYYVYRLK
jgi:hypothetical protein